MKYDFEYWERSYFEGWLGKSIVVAFVTLCFYALLKYTVEPWAIETLCSTITR